MPSQHLFRSGEHLGAVETAGVQEVREHGLESVAWTAELAMDGPHR